MNDTLQLTLFNESQHAAPLVFPAAARPVGVSAKHFFSGKVSLGGVEKAPGVGLFGGVWIFDLQERAARCVGEQFADELKGEAGPDGKTEYGALVRDCFQWSRRSMPLHCIRRCMAFTGRLFQPSAGELNAWFGTDERLAKYAAQFEEDYRESGRYARNYLDNYVMKKLPGLFTD